MSSQFTKEITIVNKNEQIFSNLTLTSNLKYKLKQVLLFAYQIRAS